MAQEIKTLHGLKYTLSDDIYNQIQSVDGGTNSIWNPLNQVVENAALIDTFLGTLCFCLLPFLMNLNWYFIPLISIGASLLGKVLSNYVFVFRGILLSILLFLFQHLTMFFIHYIAIILVAVFAIHNFLAALIYIVVSFVLDIVLTQSHEKRQPFNDRAALALIKPFQ